MIDEVVPNPSIMENLHNISILCTFPARGEDRDSGTWVQSVNYVAEENALYVANQANNGEELRIDKREVNGTFIESQIVPIESGTYVESLSYFYKETKELVFIIFSQKSSCSLYNYTTGTLSMIQLPFRGLHKNAIYKDFFVTTTMIDKKLRSFYFYNLEETKRENMSEPLVLKPDYSLPLWQKSQGFVVAEGHIVVALGTEHGHPGLVIIDGSGNLRQSIVYDVDTYRECLGIPDPNANETMPMHHAVLSSDGAVEKVDLGASVGPQHDSYENEGIFMYKDKLCLVQIFNGSVVLVLHNDPDGKFIEPQKVRFLRATDWEPVALLNRTVPYAGDTIPRIKRVGSVVRLEGAIKGLRSTNVNIAQIDPDWAPERNVQFTCPVSGGGTANWQISRNGVVKIIAVSKSSINTSTWFPFSFEWDIE